MLKHVLVTLDGSELSETALDYSRQIVAPDGRITLLSVMDMPETQVYTMYEVPVVVQTDDYNKFVASAESGARDYLKRMAELLADKCDCQIQSEFAIGDPASVIIDRAKALKVDAIVMSTHGRSGISRWLFGSVTHRVMSEMPCPVFVIPGLKLMAARRDTREEEAVGG